MHELLAPAGSPTSLEAAVNAGADAVYLGGSTHNARIYGENFTDTALSEAVSFCHARHVRVYLTLNTLLTDRELSEMCARASFLAELGIDAVIVQDVGLAELLRRAVPTLPLHASTQMTVHNLSGIRRARDLGFSRVVLSREAWDPNLIRSSPVETEVFIHGALCVSYSGQCYFSSMLAGRSGNRGACAQPCRHLYKNGYELSLHDLCMASHITELLKLPISSLKIEGRLKSAEYVAGTVGIYRRLLDEGRNATKEEIFFLQNLFSRQGFTDGYFLRKPSRYMFGYRTESDKEKTKKTVVSMPEAKKIPLSMALSFQKDAPCRLSLTDGRFHAAVTGDIPEKAEKKSVCEEDLIRLMSKTGGTPYTPSVKVLADDGLFLPVSALNDLRRRGINALYEASREKRDVFPVSLTAKTQKIQKTKTYYIFHSPLQIPKALCADAVFLPLFAPPCQLNHIPVGVILPTVFSDAETEAVQSALRNAKDRGVRLVMCHTIGQSLLVRELGMLPVGGTGLHIMNSEAMLYSDMTEVTASPELSLSQLRDMPKPLPTNVLIYGRLTLMTLENCLARNRNACHHGNSFYPLTDIKGNVFPVLCAFRHRNEVLNARPLYMADKLSLFKDASVHAFILRFTTETPQEVSHIISLYQNGAPADFPFTRGRFFREEESKTEK